MSIEYIITLIKENKNKWLHYTLLYNRLRRVQLDLTSARRQGPPPVPVWSLYFTLSHTLRSYFFIRRHRILSTKLLNQGLLRIVSSFKKFCQKISKPCWKLFYMTKHGIDNYMVVQSRLLFLYCVLRWPCILGNILLNATTVYWSVCTKPGKWGDVYLWVRNIALLTIHVITIHEYAQARADIFSPVSSSHICVVKIRIIHELNSPDLKVSSATFNDRKFEWIYFPSLSQNSLLRLKFMKFMLSVCNIYQIHYNYRSFLDLVVDCHISIIVGGAATFTSGECRPCNGRYCDKTTTATRKTAIGRWSLNIFFFRDGCIGSWAT